MIRINDFSVLEFMARLIISFRMRHISCLSITKFTYLRRCFGFKKIFLRVNPEKFKWNVRETSGQSATYWITRSKPEKSRICRDSRLKSSVPRKIENLKFDKTARFSDYNARAVQEKNYKVNAIFNLQFSSVQRNYRILFLVSLIRNAAWLNNSKQPLIRLRSRAKHNVLVPSGRNGNLEVI